jgi:hypothetical protein
MMLETSNLMAFEPISTAATLILKSTAIKPKIFFRKNRIRRMLLLYSPFLLIWGKERRC